MNTIVIFFKEHGKVILIGIGGVILGVVLNNMVRAYENKSLLQTLTKELDTLKEKMKTQMLTDDEKKQMDKLIGEIYILTFKCK